VLPAASSTPPPDPSRARRRHRRILVGLLGALVVVVIAAVAGYFLLFKDDSPPKFHLSKPTGTTVAPSGSLAGTWNATSGGQAGYRIREKLGFLPAPSDAVGRTSAVTSTFTITDEQGELAAHDIAVKVDMTTLKSDDSRRDGRLRQQAIETDRYPTATFEATGPITVPDDARAGGDFTVSVTGDLTLHGITRTVTVPIQGRASANSVELVGSYTFPLSDFKIDKPNSPFVVSIEDNGTLEFKLQFRKR
jgi:polyisoprenoid-binding protein YceI